MAELFDVHDLQIVKRVFERAGVTFPGTRNQCFQQGHGDFGDLVLFNGPQGHTYSVQLAEVQGRSTEEVVQVIAEILYLRENIKKVGVARGTACSM